MTGSTMANCESSREMSSPKLSRSDDDARKDWRPAVESDPSERTSRYEVKDEYKKDPGIRPKLLNVVKL